MKSSHLLAALLGVLVTICGLGAGEFYAGLVEEQYVHALPPRSFPKKSLGKAVQRAALTQADLLTQHGSSELVIGVGPHSATLIFKNAHARPLSQTAGWEPANLTHSPNVAPLVPTSAFGVQVLTPASDPKFVPLMAQAKKLGAQWVRVYLGWWSIQPNSSSDWVWSYPDALFNGLAGQDLAPIVTIAGNPAWAAAYPNGPIDPAHLTDFGNFVSALANRYPNVQYWEFYNESDSWIQGPQHGWGGHGDQYAAMLKTAYNAIHPNGAAGAGRVPQYVVFGGVAFESNETCPDRPNRQCFDNNFVGDVLNTANGSSLFDVMAFHYYDAFAGNYTPPSIIGKALKLKQTYPQIKDKPLVVTELGKSYSFGSNPNFSHELAARRVVQLFADLMSGADSEYDLNILAGIWFTLDHYEEPATGTPRMWGLLDQTGNPWPLEGAAWATTVHELSNARYINRIADTPGVEGYNFTATDGSVHAVLRTIGDAVRYSFPLPHLRWLDKQGTATRVSDNGLGDSDPRAGWIGLTITSSPIFVEYPSQTSPPLLWGGNSFLRELQMRLFAVVCGIFHIPCELN